MFKYCFSYKNIIHVNTETHQILEILEQQYPNPIFSFLFFYFQFEYIYTNSQIQNICKCQFIQQPNNNK